LQQIGARNNQGNRKLNREMGVRKRNGIVVYRGFLIVGNFLVKNSHQRKKRDIMDGIS